MTKLQASVLHRDINAALTAVAEKHSMLFTGGTLRFDATSARMGINFVSTTATSVNPATGKNSVSAELLTSGFASPGKNTKLSYKK